MATTPFNPIITINQTPSPKSPVQTNPNLEKEIPSPNFPTMAVSRRLALLSVGTILLCFLFIRAAVADSDYGDDIHTVRHSEECKGERPDKGDQCREEHGVVVDDDFDDTYKIVNNIKVSLSSSGSILKEMEEAEAEETPASEEEVGSMSILGH